MRNHCTHPYKGKPEDIQVFYEGPVISQAEARSGGIRHYFTGVVCHRGHLDKRYVSTGMCCSCKREYQRENKHNWTPSEWAKEKQKERMRAIQRQPKWKAYNAEKARRRQFWIKKVTPTWADMKTIRQIYADCPDGYHVDHIVPIKNELVCGLHVPANLRAIPGEENLAKSNHFDPDSYVHELPKV